VTVELPLLAQAWCTRVVVQGRCVGEADKGAFGWKQSINHLPHGSVLASFRMRYSRERRSRTPCDTTKLVRRFELDAHQSLREDGDEPSVTAG
jgi:hypothetical protein